MNKKIVAILSVTLLLFTAIIFSFNTLKKVTPAKESTKLIVAKLVKECQLKTSAPLNPLFPLINSNNERCIKERLVGLSIKEQILVANGLLDTNLISYCHATIHGLGIDAFKSTGNIPDAIKLGSPGCLFGFYHGVVSAAGETLSAQTIIDQTKNLCVGLKEPSEPLHNCTHAIGHGIAAATKDNMEEGIPYCEMLPSHFTRYQCLVGLLMEDFISVRMQHPDGNFPAPFTPALCHEEKRGIDFQKACVNMFFILITQKQYEANQGALGLRDYCDSFVVNEIKLECYHSLGTESAQFMAFDPKIIAMQTCGEEVNEFSLRCAQGAGLVYGMNYGFAKKQSFFCKLFQTELANACLGITKEEIFTTGQ